MSTQVRSGWMTLLVVGAMMAGCTNETEVLRRQVEQLRVELAQLRAASANSTVMMEDLQNKVLLLEDQMDSTRLALGRSPSSGGGSMGTTGLPVMRISPPTYQAEAYEEEVEDDGEEERWNGGTPQVVFQHIGEDGKVSMGPPPAERPAETRPAAKVAGKPPVAKPAAPKPAKTFDAEPIELYKVAYDQLQKKQHAEAIAGFQKLIEAYPNHDYADNALYWMGEAYYDKQDFAKAIECFDKLLTLYPEGNKVPDALLKTALCYQNQGDSASAKQWAERLLATYPQTTAAAGAREKIRSDW